VLLIAFALGALPAAAGAAANIHSNGPLTDVWIADDLGCQAAHKGDPTYSFYPPKVAPGDCGTFLAVGGTVFGPDFERNSDTSFPGGDTYQTFTPGSQSGVTGAGTDASPFQVVTSATAGGTGLTVTEVDSYVTTKESYRTDITVANSGGEPVTAVLYHAADCYLVGSDVGFGAITAQGTPACTANPNNSPSGRVEELFPLTGGFRFEEGRYSTVWDRIVVGGALPNTCDCAINQDNGMAVSWDITVPPGGSVSYSLITNLSAGGQVTGAPAVVTGRGTRSSGNATLTGSVNPEGKQVTDCHFTWGTSRGYGRSVPCSESVGAGTAPVEVSARLSGVQPGKTYHYRLWATTSGGTTTGQDRVLGTPLPTLGKTANVTVVSGTVLVDTPGGPGSTRGLFAIVKGAGFVPITEEREIPMGSTLDARRGTLDLVAAGAQPGTTGSARLAGGLFTVTQQRRGRSKGLTTFRLRQGLFKGAPSYKSCPRNRKGRGSSVAHASRVSRKALQTLKARHRKGKFRTRGRFSAGTVRGTTWETTDRCDGTLTTVRRGIVDVRNFGLRKTVPVRAGYHYLSAADRSRQRKPQRNR
jgi:hypothetical protein